MLTDKPNQIKDIVFKIKSLQQKIRPITIGAGASRPYVFVVFDKEAAAQFVPNTLVYLSWKHTCGKKVTGYNVFTQVSKKPNVWKILLPSSLLYEGTVLARIELVDGKTIAASNTFEINVLYNPNEDESFTQSDDYGVFQQAILELTDRINQTKNLLEQTQNTVKDLNDLFSQVEEFYNILLQEKEENDEKIDSALSNSYESLTIAMEALNQLTWGQVE